MEPLIGLIALAALAVATPAAAQSSARCFTTDDGQYDCRFEQLDDKGSFRISAEGYPTFELWIEEPGLATGSGQYEPGGRFVALPGEYRRDTEDRACWINGETDTRICAW